MVKEVQTIIICLRDHGFVLNTEKSLWTQFRALNIWEYCWTILINIWTNSYRYPTDIALGEEVQGGQPSDADKPDGSHGIRGCDMALLSFKRFALFVSGGQEGPPENGHSCGGSSILGLMFGSADLMQKGSRNFELSEIYLWEKIERIALQYTFYIYLGHF